MGSGSPAGHGASGLTRPTQEGAGAASGAVLGATSGIVENAGITLIGAAMGAVLALGNEVLAAHFLGVVSYGFYAIALMIAKVGEILAVFGLPLSVLHYLPVHLSRGESGHALGAIIGATLLPLAIGICFACGLALGGSWIAAHIFAQSGAGRFIAIAGLAIPLLALADLLGNVARGFGRALPYVIIRNLTPALVFMLILVGLTLSQGSHLGVPTGYVAGVVVGVLVGIGFVQHFIHTRIGRVRPVMQILPLYRYAVPVMINAIVSLAMVWTDLFLLSIFTEASTVGIYRGCMQAVIAFDLVWNACSAATAPIYPVLIAERQQGKLQETYSGAVRLSTLLATPIMMLLLVNGSDVLGLLGRAFTVGGWALVVLAFGQYVKVAFGNASVVLIVGGRQSLEAKNGAAAALFNLALNLLLVPRFGLMGAAIATATSQTFLGLLRGMQLRRVMQLHTLDFAILRMLLVTVPLTLLIWVASIVVGIGPGSGLLALVVRIAVMGLALGGALWQFCLTREDRASLLRLVRRRGSARAAATAS